MLDTRLLAGKWRELHSKELEQLYELTGLKTVAAKRASARRTLPDDQQRGRAPKTQRRRDKK